MIYILGIDPGGAYTGLCKINYDKKVMRACVLTRTEDQWRGYFAEIREAIDDYLLEPGVVVAIEDVVEPKAYYRGKKQMLPVSSVMGVSRVFGAIEMYLLSKGYDPVVVPPAGNGSGDLANYPSVLVGARETKGTGILNHARSAYDVALTAMNDPLGVNA